MKLCISHKKDVDGITAAALVKAVTGSELKLVDYNELLEALEGAEGYEEVYICDLGMIGSKTEEELSAFRRIASSSKLVYIDHHRIAPKVKAKIRRMGVVCVHSEKDCASVLVYDHFKESLPEEASLLAACAAVTDYLDDGPIAKKLISRYERMFVYLNAGMLAYALSRRAKDRDFPYKLAEWLSKLQPPYKIPGLVELAKDRMDQIWGLMKELKEKAERIGNLGFVKSNFGDCGLVANLLTGVLGVPVGMAFTSSGDMYKISLRGSEGCRWDLGRLADEISGELGGMGGGHRKASGAVIPKSKLDEFVKSLAERLKS